MGLDNNTRGASLDLEMLRRKSRSGNLRSGLGERKLKNAIKTVFKNFGEYASFFAALFIIQSLLWLLLFTTTANIIRERQTIENEYDYHFLVEHLTQPDIAILENTFAITDVQIARAYKSYEIIKPSGVNDFYSLRVRLQSKTNFDTFVQYYLVNNGIDTSRLQITTTPLYTYEQEYVGDNISDVVWTGLFLVGLFVVLLMALFGIRLNHYKFMYGIYMTCGAGSRRLFSSSIWEMTVIACTTLIASFLFGYGICAVIYSTAQIPFDWWMVLVVLAINLIVVFFSVRVPIWRLARCTPISLIVAQDNSNLVTSPRRSFKIFNKSFPYHYELFTTWRFRKYFISTLISAILFTSVFLWTVYVGYMKKTDEAVMGPEFIAYIDMGRVDMSGTSEDMFNVHDIVEMVNEVQHEVLDDIDGVSHTSWERATDASEINSHLLIGERVGGGTDYAVSTKDSRTPQKGYDRALNMYSYTAVDTHFIDTLCQIYEVEGDPYAVLDDRNKIIISDSLYNSKSFDFQIGDRVLAGKRIHGRLEESDYMILSDTEILRKLLEKCAYEYKEYEIAAIVHDYDAKDRLLFGMNYMEYYEFAGKNDYQVVLTSDNNTNNGLRIVNMRGTIKIFTDKDLDSSESEMVLLKIREALENNLGIYDMDIRIQRNFCLLRDELVAQRHTYDRMITIAVLLLLLSPIIWFFSQLLFYFKREKEMNIIRMFGAVERDIKRLYGFAGLILSGISIVFTVVLGYISIYGIYKLCNNILIKYGLVSGTKYEFYISVPALLVCVGVSVVCGFLSSYIPYIVSARRRSREIAKEKRRTDNEG